MSNNFEALCVIVVDVIDVAPLLRPQEPEDVVFMDNAAAPRTEILLHMSEISSSLDLNGQDALGNDEAGIQYALESAQHIWQMIEGEKSTLVQILNKVEEFHDFINMDEIAQRRAVEALAKMYESLDPGSSLS